MAGTNTSIQLPTQPANQRITFTPVHTPGPAGGDPHQLRGIPAIGHSVSGHIVGTRPDLLYDDT